MYISVRNTLIIFLGIYVIKDMKSILKVENGNNEKYSLFGQRLNRLLKQKKVTQKEFGEYVGLTQQGVGSWLIGKTSPNLDSLRLIRSFFDDVPYDYFLCDTESQKFENKLVVDVLGLSDEAIASLRELKDTDKLKTLEIISELIVNPRFLSFIMTLITELDDFRNGDNKMYEFK